MSWCPKCKTEYRAGITVCADCGSTLVDELEKEYPQCAGLFAKEEGAKKFTEFLAYSDIKEFEIRYEETEDSYGVYVTEDEIKDAKKLFSAYAVTEMEKENAKKDALTTESVETVEETTEESNEEEAEEVTKATEDAEDEIEDDVIPLSKAMPKTSVTYVKKEERYNDFRSTFYIFLVFGVLGLIFTILNMVGVMSILTTWMQYILLGVFSIAFIVIAIVSYNKSKILFDEIDTEQEITATIKNWLSENITAETLAQFDNDEDPKEITFFKKTDYIKSRLYERYTFDNDAYVDELIEEFYTENFDK